MQIQKLPKIQVTVTTTATTLEDLLTTANGGTALSGVVGDRNEINAITFQPEAEVRYS
ncbi:MAG: hypothetical protein GY861_28795 [bacterium]|nr:hypothetical protein [bacterium]